MKKIFIVIIVLFFIAVAATVVYFLGDFNRGNLSADKTPEATATPSDPNIKKYTNTELGFSFEYPARYGEVNIEILVGGKAGGQTGEKLTGT
ncbi:MAG: hypothetical protein UV36_C0001G0001, partial [Parcubacteria group bacterium GW2011_GWC2_42_6]